MSQLPLNIKNLAENDLLQWNLQSQAFTNQNIAGILLDSGIGTLGPTGPTGPTGPAGLTSQALVFGSSSTEYYGTVNSGTFVAVREFLYRGTNVYTLTGTKSVVSGNNA